MGKRCSSTRRPSLRPRAKSRPPPPESVSQSTSAGRRHRPMTPRSGSNAWAAALTRCWALSLPPTVRRIRATTVPPGSTWSEPCVTACLRWKMERSGTSHLPFPRSPRSCTTRPELVPTTTQPTSVGSKLQEPGSSGRCIRRQPLFTARDSTCSPRLACSQPPAMAQVRLGLLRGCALALAGSGHSARLGPCARSTSTRQAPPSAGAHTTLMSRSAWPSRPAQRSTGSKRAAARSRRGLGSRAV
mmetsp:Transcript_91635/g.259555  ORF Transcript_91635/g.259555 Transcript_91635/m.259555 type:complete len:244 (+) Transcript_91635:151-882(+)